jgi:catechol 2,3-dioxygenase-like lactoylglutathione lyase family enzyme
MGGELMTPTFQVTFDCADPDRLARFWAEVLGYELDRPPEGYASWEDYLRAMGIPEEDWNMASAIVDPAGQRPRIFFQRVPEGKVVKNRVHLDVNVGGGRSTPREESRKRVDAEVERVLTLGATKLRRLEEHGEYCVVMQDLEGNEFCLQ